MPRKSKKVEKKDPEGFYKGYDIKWLESIGEEHPDFHLVAEYKESKKDS